jgi:hypothetical protein
VEFDRMLAELFAEEDRARDMANRLITTAQSSRAAAAAERDSLIAFLRGPMERHMVYEEERIFPQLEKHDLTEEVQVAVKQHAAVRAAGDELATAAHDEVAVVIVDTAKLLLHHTNFEGDYIYPELTLEQWRALMRESTR